MIQLYIFLYLLKDPWGITGARKTRRYSDAISNQTNFYLVLLFRFRLGFTHFCLFTPSLRGYFLTSTCVRTDIQRKSTDGGSIEIYATEQRRWRNRAPTMESWSGLARRRSKERNRRSCCRSASSKAVVFGGNPESLAVTWPSLGFLLFPVRDFYLLYLFQC